MQRSTITVLGHKPFLIGVYLYSFVTGDQSGQSARNKAQNEDHTNRDDNEAGFFHAADAGHGFGCKSQSKSSNDGAIDRRGAADQHH